MLGVCRWVYEDASITELGDTLASLASSAGENAQVRRRFACTEGK